jgi:hypothetical protein
VSELSERTSNAAPALRSGAALVAAVIEEKVAR